MNVCSVDETEHFIKELRVSLSEIGRASSWHQGRSAEIPEQTPGKQRMKDRERDKQLLGHFNGVNAAASWGASGRPTTHTGKGDVFTTADGGPKERPWQNKNSELFPSLWLWIYPLSGIQTKFIGKTNTEFSQEKGNHKVPTHKYSLNWFTTMPFVTCPSCPNSLGTPDMHYTHVKHKYYVRHVSYLT